MVSLLRVHAVRGHRLSLCPRSVRRGSESTMWPPRPWAETTLWVQTVYRSITKSLPWLVQATLPGTQIIITRGQNQVSKGKRRNLDTKASKKNCPKAISSKWKCYRNILHIEWLYRAGDGELTGMRKMTECAHDDVTAGQPETIHRASKSTHTCREGKKRQMSEC